MNIDDIKKVLILGAGTMGQQIGLQCAMNGYEVVYYDLSRRSWTRRSSGWPSWLTGMPPPVGSPGAAPADSGRITSTADPAEAARDADLISESVPEDPEIKGKVFAQFNALCPERTIFTTNTSMLVPSMFAEATGRPEKLVRAPLPRPQGHHRRGRHAPPGHRSRSDAARP